jgi:hypothetical protein
MSGTNAALEERPFGTYHFIRIVAGRWSPGNSVRPLKAGQDFGNFHTRTEQHLRTIDSRPIGQLLLKKLNKRCEENTQTCIIVLGKTTMIDPDGDNIPGYAEVYLPSMVHAVPPTAPGPADFRVRQASYMTAPGQRGAGSPALVCYNPDFNYSTALEQLIHLRTPPFVALAHELVHALHIVSGKVWRPGDAAGGFDKRQEMETMVEEARTVGCGKYASRKITENGIRAEHGLPLRQYYATPGDCDGARLPDCSPLAPEDKDF